MSLQDQAADRSGNHTATRADGNFMYTVNSRNKVHIHKVEIGRDLGGQFEIASGIAPADQVIVSPSDLLREGMQVSPVMQTFAAKLNEKKTEK